MRTSRGAAPVFLLALLAAGCPARNAAGPVEPASAAPVRAEVEVYFMSQCPFSAKLMKMLPDVMAAMGGSVELTLRAVIDRHEDGEFVATHGTQELFGNVLALCASRSSPDAPALASFMACFSDSIATIPFGWEDCATAAGIPLGPVKACALGDEGKELLQSSYDAVESHGVEGSPYVFIDGVPFNIKLTDETLTEAICCALPVGARPAACPSAPACYNVRVDLTVVTDQRCEDCQEKVLETLVTFSLPFPLMEVDLVDYADQGAAELLEKADVDLLPAYLFHSNVEDSAAYVMLEEHVYDAGGYHVVMPDAVDSTFDPRREICTNGVDDTGNGLTDCDDPDCDGVLACRAEIPARLDVFVMSLCPFGNEAVKAAAVVHSHFKGALAIELHWITTVVELERFSDSGLPDVCEAHGDKAFCSLHGVEEIEEDLRQICAQSLYPAKKFMAYARCMSSPGQDMDWVECASASDMDTDRLEACATGDEGHALLAEDAHLGDLVGADASPTYLWNNHIVESVSFTPASIAAKACELNPGLSGCGKIDMLEDEGMPVPPEARCYE